MCEMKGGDQQWMKRRKGEEGSLGLTWSMRYPLVGDCMLELGTGVIGHGQGK